MIPTPEQLEETIRRVETLGAAGAMRFCDEEKGYKIITEAPWLNRGDWAGDIVISQDGHRIRILAIIAAVHSGGAFSRLVNTILQAGLKPVVIAPSGEMKRILTRWEWRKIEIGDSYDTFEEQWFLAAPVDRPPPCAPEGEAAGCDYLR